MLFRSVGMLGDLCVDIYWKADMRKSELSRETPHFPLPMVEERFSLGAGGNVAANLNALGAGEIYAVGIIGKDWRGKILNDILNETQIKSDYIIESDKMITNAYCKPLRTGISDVCYEDPRLDFTNYSPMSKPDESRLLSALAEVSKKADVICVSDQFLCGVMTETIRNEVMRLAKNGLTVIVDSRDRIGLYENVCLKPNEVEAGKMLEADFDGSLEQYIRPVLKLNKNVKQQYLKV